MGLRLIESTLKHHYNYHGWSRLMVRVTFMGPYLYAMCHTWSAPVTTPHKVPPLPPPLAAVSADMSDTPCQPGLHQHSVSPQTHQAMAMHLEMYLMLSHPAVVWGPLIVRASSPYSQRGSSLWADPIPCMYVWGQSEGCRALRSLPGNDNPCLHTKGLHLFRFPGNHPAMLCVHSSPLISLAGTHRTSSATEWWTCSCTHQWVTEEQTDQHKYSWNRMDPSTLINNKSKWRNHIIKHIWYVGPYKLFEITKSRRALVWCEKNSKGQH